VPLVAGGGLVGAPLLIADEGPIVPWCSDAFWQAPTQASRDSPKRLASFNVEHEPCGVRGVRASVVSARRAHVAER
jgi:hypothetical protein